MLDKQKILSKFYSTLHELEMNGFKYPIQNPTLLLVLQSQLSCLADILDDDIPEEYWEPLETVLQF